MIGMQFQYAKSSSGRKKKSDIWKREKGKSTFKKQNEKKAYTKWTLESVKKKRYLIVGPPSPA